MPKSVQDGLPNGHYLARALNIVLRYPYAIAIDSIWKLFDEIWEEIPVEQQLPSAALVIAAITQVIAQKSQQLLKDWSDRTDPLGPTVSENIFSGLVRTTVQLDLEDLKAPTPPQTFKKHNSRSSVYFLFVCRLRSDRALSKTLTSALRDREIS